MKSKKELLDDLGKHERTLKFEQKKIINRCASPEAIQEEMKRSAYQSLLQEKQRLIDELKNFGTTEEEVRRCVSQATSQASIFSRKCSTERTSSASASSTHGL